MSAHSRQSKSHAGMVHLRVEDQTGHDLGRRRGRRRLTSLMVVSASAECDVIAFDAGRGERTRSWVVARVPPDQTCSQSDYFRGVITKPHTGHDVEFIVREVEPGCLRRVAFVHVVCPCPVCMRIRPESRDERVVELRPGCRVDPMWPTFGADGAHGRTCQFLLVQSNW